MKKIKIGLDKNMMRIIAKYLAENSVRREGRILFYQKTSDDYYYWEEIIHMESYHFTYGFSTCRPDSGVVMDVDLGIIYSMGAR